MDDRAWFLWMYAVTVVFLLIVIIALFRGGGGDGKD